MYFWAGWAFGFFCGILFVFAVTAIGVAIEAAKQTDVKTFQSALSQKWSGINPLQRIALWSLIQAWKMVEWVKKSFKR